MEYKKVDFALGQNRPKLKIDYTQVDFANAPVRLAFIDSKMFTTMLANKKDASSSTEHILISVHFLTKKIFCS